jgi:hypothetical protein
LQSTAVDDERLNGHVTGGAGSEEKQRALELVGLRDTAEQRAIADGLLEGGIGQEPRQLMPALLTSTSSRPCQHGISMMACRCRGSARSSAMVWIRLSHLPGQLLETVGAWRANTLMTSTFKPVENQKSTLNHRCGRACTVNTDRQHTNCHILLEPALVAQRIEHLTTDQKVGGSNPFERAQVRAPFRFRKGLFC